MKQLLFSTSLLLAVACSSHKKSETQVQEANPSSTVSEEKTIEPTPGQMDTAAAVQAEETSENDGPKVVRSAPKKREAGKAVKVNNGTSGVSGQTEMPRHDAPDQAKIDSTKRELEKGKK